jgi:outer membrane biosynthesis protein TonB
MTPDDARKLLGGYATGSLTEAERRALFQAALEDQELFDELAGEQVLKEVLDEPGARQRLLATLESGPHRIAWWMRPWPWAAAAATLAVVIGVVIFNRTPPPEPPQQVAQVLKSAEPVAPPAPAPAPSPPTPKRKVAPAPPPPPAELKKEEALTDQLQEAKPQADTAVRGFVASAPAAAARLAENAAVRAPGQFVFNYTVSADGFLVVVPAARGFLSVTANNAAIYPSGAVSAGTPVRIAIPPDATSLVIAFSGMPGITGSPVRSDEMSGTVTDQDPPNARILIQLFLKPATR